MLKQSLFHNIIHTKAPTFKRKANWISPPFDNQTFVSFFNCVVQELGPINPQYQENYSNLTMNEKTALNNLKNNQTIVIKPCDKVKGISIRYSLITIHTFSIPQYIQTTHPQTNKHTCPGRSHSHTLYAFPTRNRHSQYGISFASQVYRHTYLLWITKNTALSALFFPDGMIQLTIFHPTSPTLSSL